MMVCTAGITLLKGDPHACMPCAQNHLIKVKELCEHSTKERKHMCVFLPGQSRSANANGLAHTSFAIRRKVTNAPFYQHRCDPLLK